SPTTIEPGRQFSQEELAISSGSSTVSPYTDVLGRNLSRSRVGIEGMQDSLVVLLEQVGCESPGLSLQQVIRNLLVQTQVVVDFLVQVLLGWRGLQFALNVFDGLIFSEGVPLDCRACQHPLRQEHLHQVAGVARAQGDARQMLTL